MRPFPEAELPAVRPFYGKGHPLIAWLIIAAGVAVIFWIQFARQHESRAENAAGSNSQTRMATEMQARMLVGMASLEGKSGKGSPELTKQAQQLNVGDGGNRLRAIIVMGELAGPQEALTQLDRLEHARADGHVSFNPAQEEVLAMLRLLYRDYQAGDWSSPSLTAKQRDQLRQRLGWFGELALAPAAGPDAAARAAVLATAQRAAIAAGALVLLMLVAGVAGAIGLLLFLVFVLNGRLRTWLTTGSPAGGIYAETFAIWMFLFWGLNYAASLVRVPDSRAGLLGLASLLSLTALAWPVLRGYTWRQVRQEVGLTAGRRPALEPLFGLATYALALPLALVGMLVMLLLIRLQHAMRGEGGAIKPTDMPSHPIVEPLVHLDWSTRVQLIVVACAIVPLVEETMFRGVLYRHLREATRSMRLGLSVLLSATVVSFVFAVIHPQGILGVPLLMGLAYAFALAREWRDTLVPGIVAHGIVNGITFALLLLVMG
jgi:membrane protease YdiL (CAAX protease family)